MGPLTRMIVNKKAVEYVDYAKISSELVSQSWTVFMCVLFGDDLLCVNRILKKCVGSIECSKIILEIQ